MSERILKVNELIAQQLGLIIREECEFPSGTIVSITKVSTSKDLRFSQIYISVIPDEQRGNVVKLLIKQAQNLQRILNDKIVLRNIPRLRFHADNTEKEAQKIDQVLDNLKY